MQKPTTKTIRVKKKQQKQIEKPNKYFKCNLIQIH